MVRISAGLIAVAVAGWASSAGAVAYLPGPKFVLNTTNLYQKSGVPISTSYADSFGSLTAKTEVLPAIRADVSGSTTQFGDFIQADATITYYLTVLTGAPSKVRLLIDSAGGVGGSGNYVASASVGMFGPTQTYSLAYAHACKGCSGNIFFNGGPRSIWVDSNIQYSIKLNANGYTQGPNSFFTAFADPTVIFDPDYQRPADAQLIFSEGLGLPSSPVLPDDNSGAVPEPSTWALLLMGFLGAGAGLRRACSGGVRRSAAAG